jgi:hypothetical protein
LPAAKATRRWNAEFEHYNERLNQYGISAHGLRDDDAGFVIYIHPVYQRGGDRDGLRFDQRVAYELFKKYAIEYRGEGTSGTIASMTPGERFAHFLVSMDQIASTSGSLPQEWEWERWDPCGASGDNDFIVHGTIPMDEFDEDTVESLIDLRNRLVRDFTEAARRQGFTNHAITDFRPGD